MIWSSGLVLLLMSVCRTSGQEREDGILYDHTALGIRPYYPVKMMRSNGFPNQAPHDLVQTWRYVAVVENGEKSAISINCNRMYIPKAAGSNDCGEFKMTVRDGKKVSSMCGDMGQYRLLSKSNDVKFEFHSGPNGGGLVDCTAEAVILSDDGQILTTTTTTTPRPTKPSYQNQVSYEVDSSEDGGEPGDKGTTCPCGWANKVTSRIVNGTETARNEFPFAVGLVYKGTRARFCGGTIISSYFALTASHCTASKEASRLAIIVGIHNVNEDFDGPAKEYPLEKIVMHPNYDPENGWHNDIALLVTKKEISFSQWVGPACLPPASPQLDLDRKYIKIIGWGAMEFKGHQSPVLRKVDVRVVPIKECQYMYKHVPTDKPIQICTYATRKASCQGDSGGPVMWVDPETNRYTHVGIVSFGRVCGDISPSVHARVQSYLDWIRQEINASNKPKSQTCSRVD